MTYFLNNTPYRDIDNIFNLFPRDKWKRDDDDFLYNFIGGKFRKKYFPKLGSGEKENRYYWNATLMTNKDPAYCLSEDYYEWIDLLYSVKNAKESYTMLKLGAHSARWEIFAYIANTHLNQLPMTLVSVESALHRKKFIKQNFKDNAVDMSAVKHEIIHAFVGDKTSKNKNRISLTDVIEKHELIDLIDSDIQGAEIAAFPSAVEALNKRVKRVHIGTHSNEIDDILYDLFSSMKWKNLYNFRSNSDVNIRQGFMSFQDGIQSWVNPRLEQL